MAKQRLNNPSGDRFEVIQLFEGASIMDPHVAKTTRHHEAMSKLEKLRFYPTLNKEGPETIVPAPCCACSVAAQPGSLERQKRGATEACIGTASY